jgi:hypothetical protein
MNESREGQAEPGKGIGTKEAFLFGKNRPEYQEQAAGHEDVEQGYEQQCTVAGYGMPEKFGRTGPG